MEVTSLKSRFLECKVWVLVSAIYSIGLLWECNELIAANIIFFLSELLNNVKLSLRKIPYLRLISH